MRYAVCLLFLFSAACSPSVQQKPESIRVFGEGKIRAKPNQVTLTLQVAFTKPRLADAVRTTQATVDSVLTILKPFSRSENDIKTSSVSANKDYQYNGRTQVLMGYRAEQSLNFVLNDINQFTALTGKLMGTKISSISHIQFGHSQADSLFREADLLAYDDALKSAQKLCKRANVGLGKLRYLSNAGVSGHAEQDAYYAAPVSQEMNTYGKAFGGSGFKISPEVLEFRRQVVSEYEIAP